MSQPTNPRQGTTATRPTGVPNAAGQAYNPRQSTAWTPAVTIPTFDGQAVRAQTVAGRLGEASTSFRRAMAGTPGRLRILALLCVAVSLAFAITAFATLRSTDDALRRGADNSSQLVRMQAIHTSLFRADADATNAFLVGGLEPAEQRTDYSSSLAQASRLIAEAAKSQPADGPALGALNGSVLTYASLVEQARATNRQALPVGAEYLRLASAGLRRDALPILDALVGANEARVTAEFDGAAGASALLLGSGLLALLVLIGGMVWLARRTHRYINVPLVGATAAVLVVLLAGALSLVGIGSQVNDVRNGSYAATLATAKARIAAFDAKSNESLTLIARGSGAEFEKSWVASSKVVTAQSATSARLNIDAAKKMGALWTAYTQSHTSIRKADNDGKWEDAVRQAIGIGATSANAAFLAFDSSSGTALTSSSHAVTDSLDAPRSWLSSAAWLALLVGIAAAGAAYWGISLRLEEYR